MKKSTAVYVAVVCAVLALVFTLLLCLSTTGGALWSALMLVSFLVMAAAIARYMFAR